jgi:hypothetical protein
MFRIGQKVVCINGTPDPTKKSHPGVVFPKTGKIYTIRDIWGSQTHPDRVGITLEEIRNPFNEVYNHEYGFDSDRFKPIDMIEDSVEWAESILTKIEEEIEEEICIDA